MSSTEVLRKRMLGATYGHSVTNGVCITCLASRRGDPLIVIQVKSRRILVSIGTVHNAVPQDAQCNQEGDADDDGKCCDHFDFFFRDTLFSVQYRSNAPKLVWVIPRISVYGKRRSTHSFLSDSIADNRMHN